MAVLLPGAGTNLGNFGTWDRIAENIREDVGDIVGRDNVAVIAWLGYTAPGSVLDAQSDIFGYRGGSELAADMRFLDTFAKPKQNTTFVAHSYGNVVAGFGIAIFGAHVDNVITLGSPGMGADAPYAMDLGGARVWSALAEGDWVGWFSNPLVGLGQRPHEEAFGSCRIETEGNRDHPQSGGGHGYLDRRTGAYENVVNIVAGQYGKVTHYGGPNCP